MCQELAKSYVLVLLIFHLPYSMWHSECCEVRSESVVSVIKQHQHTSQVFHLQLDNAVESYIIVVTEQKGNTLV